MARLEAKPGKEKEVAAFIKGALPLVQQENDTINWYALQLGSSTFGIFDTFETLQPVLTIMVWVSLLLRHQLT